MIRVGKIFCAGLRACWLAAVGWFPSGMSASRKATRLGRYQECWRNRKETGHFPLSFYFTPAVDFDLMYTRIGRIT